MGWSFCPCGAMDTGLRRYDGGVRLGPYFTNIIYVLVADQVPLWPEGCPQGGVSVYGLLHFVRNDNSWVVTRPPPQGHRCPLKKSQKIMPDKMV